LKRKGVNSELGKGIYEFGSEFGGWLGWRITKTLQTRIDLGNQIFSTFYRLRKIGRFWIPGIKIRGI
jgi:hypothetical protein